MSVNKPEARFDQKPVRDKKPRVLIDLDGVIRDFVGSLIRVYKQVYPDHQIQPITSRQIEDFFPIGTDIYRFMEPGYIEDIMENALPYPGALEALQHWKNEYEIVIVTAQPDFIKSSTYIWIGKYKIPTNEVHITYYKSQIPGIALLDDYADNLQEFADSGRMAVCLDQPWNQQWKGWRVKTVEEFFQLIQQYQYNQEKNENVSQYLT